VALVGPVLVESINLFLSRSGASFFAFYYYLVLSHN
jgi:hypothetical protein